MNHPSLALLVIMSLFGATGCETLEPNPGPQPGGQPDGDAGLVDHDAGFAGDGAPRDDATVATDAGDAAAPDAIDGRPLYLRYCAVCHGPEGRGGLSWPDSIRNMVDTFEVVNLGRNEMPGFPGLTPSDVLAIELYLSDAYVEPPVGDDPPDGGPVVGPPLTPVEVYATTCAVCHGVEGDGTPRGPQIRFPVTDYARWIVRNGRRGLGFANPMPAYAVAELPDETLLAIFEWLSSFPRPDDGAGAWRVFCGNCHGPLGGGGPVGEGVRGEPLTEWEEVIREGEGYGAYGDRDEYMPAWTRDAISAGEIRAMWLYITGGVPGIDDDDHDDDADEDHDEDYDEDYDED